MASLKRSAGPPSTPPTDAKKPKTNGSIMSFFGAPKASAGAGKGSATLDRAAEAPVSRFNKEKWVSTLTAEQKDLLKLEIETLDDSWLSHLKEEIVKPEFLNLKRFLKKEQASGAKIFPPMEEVYAWSRHTPLHKVKAVIIGQDPYHNHNQAHGLCFSVRPPTPAPPSLKNMYTAIKKDYPNFQAPPRNGGLLTPWADRGVLLLNTCLTVRAHDANSHSNKGWELFTQKAINTVAKVRSRGVVFLAWGASAAKRVEKVDNKKHCILKSVHPSPLSAHRGFFDCGHFKKTNQWLEQRYGEDGLIDWSLNPSASTFPKSTPAAAATVEPTPEKKAMETAKSQDDFLSDDDDIDALEALAAAEAMTPSGKTSEKNGGEAKTEANGDEITVEEKDDEVKPAEEPEVEAAKADESKIEIETKIEVTTDEAKETETAAQAVMETVVMADEQTTDQPIAEADNEESKENREPVEKQD